MTFNPPPQVNFPDAAAYASALVCLARLHRFRVCRQAVTKAFIRQTLWRKFGILYTLFGFITVPLWCVAIIVLIGWFEAHPGLFNQVGFGCVVRQIQSLLDTLLTALTKR